MTNRKTEIWKSPTRPNRNGNPTCWLIMMGNELHEQELVAVVEMAEGIDLSFVQEKNKGVTGVKFIDNDGNVVETADLAEDGQGLKYPAKYEHIVIDPVEDDNEAQHVMVCLEETQDAAKPICSEGVFANTIGTVEWHAI